MDPRRIIQLLRKQLRASSPFRVRPSTPSKLQTVSLVSLASLFSAIGFAGTFILLGYIIESAYREALGINLGDRYSGNTAYVASASRFFYSIIDTALAEVLSPWGAVMVLVLVALLLLATGIPRWLSNRRGRMAVASV